ncbi:MAG: hypothetical protein WD396_06575 [Pseudohongiellaceae bacterium]
MSHLQINDERLTAFLDGELPSDEMQEVREAIAADAALAARLADITQIDTLVRSHAHAMDDRPMPKAVMRGLQGTGDKIVSLNIWHRGRQVMEQHAALAAGLVMAVALLVIMVPRQLEEERLQGRLQESAALADYADYLADTLSGNTVMIDDGAMLMGRFSFRDERSRYCRQYRLQTQQTSSENVACRDAQGWTLVASLETSAAGDSEYRPTSQVPAMEALLDDMMQGDILTLEEEQTLIDQDWRPQQ